MEVSNERRKEARKEKKEGRKGGRKDINIEMCDICFASNITLRLHGCFYSNGIVSPTKCYTKIQLQIPMS